MTPPAAIQGSYADLRFVKGRKVCQIVIEIPIEAGDHFVSIFGAPNPESEIPVVVARLSPSTASPEEKPRRRFDELPIAQQAGIRASDPAFQQFAVEILKANGKTELWAAEAIRKWCGVITRADIEKSESATAAWERLENSYAAWLVAA